MSFWLAGSKKRRFVRFSLDWIFMGSLNTTILADDVKLLLLIGGWEIRVECNAAEFSKWGLAWKNAKLLLIALLDVADEADEVDDEDGWPLRVFTADAAIETGWPLLLDKWLPANSRIELVWCCICWLLFELFVIMFELACSGVVGRFIWALDILAIAKSSWVLRFTTFWQASWKTRSTWRP